MNTNARRKLAATLGAALILGGLALTAAGLHARQDGHVDPHVHSAVYRRPVTHPTYRA